MIIVLSIIISVFYYYKGIETCNFFFENEGTLRNQLDQVFRYRDTLNTVIFSSFAALAIVMSLMMVFRIRNPFKGLYFDYGLKLWIVILIQIMSLLLGTIWYILY